MAASGSAPSPGSGIRQPGSTLMRCPLSGQEIPTVIGGRLRNDDFLGLPEAGAVQHGAGPRDCGPPLWSWRRTLASATDTPPTLPSRAPTLVFSLISSVSFDLTNKTYRLAMGSGTGVKEQEHDRAGRRD